MAAVVVLDDFFAMVCWLWWYWASLPQKWALDDLPRLQSPIFEDESTVEEWQEKDGVDRDNAESDAENTSSDLTTGPIIQLERRRLVVLALVLSHHEVTP